MISLTRNPFYMTDKRKTEIIEKTLSYLINSDASDELLYKILHDHIGMSKEELNSFSVRSLDHLYNGQSPVERLVDKVNFNFGEFNERLKRMSSEELVERANEIHSVICSANHMFSAIGNEEAEYLLHFKNPLQVVSDAWYQTKYGFDIDTELSMQSVIENLMDQRDADQDYELDEPFSNDDPNLVM